MDENLAMGQSLEKMSFGSMVSIYNIGALGNFPTRLRFVPFSTFMLHSADHGYGLKLKCLKYFKML